MNCLVQFLLEEDQMTVLAGTGKSTFHRDALFASNWTFYKQNLNVQCDLDKALFVHLRRLVQLMSVSNYLPSFAPAVSLNSAEIAPFSKLHLARS